MNKFMRNLLTLSKKEEEELKKHDRWVEEHYEESLNELYPEIFEGNSARNLDIFYAETEKCNNYKIRYLCLKRYILKKEIADADASKRWMEKNKEKNRENSKNYERRKKREIENLHKELDLYKSILKKQIKEQGLI